MKPPRVVILSEAIRCTAGQRDEAYGSPTTNLNNIAYLWTAYLIGKYHNKNLVIGDIADSSDFHITSEDVAWFNVLQKMARTFNGVVKEDSYIDAAAYSAIAGECAAFEDEQ